ncbi:hypothetical protein PSU4_37560 [Pseudonocardia sulfidoxydans NBRC 16205]|uniref:Uncharacterized protein n=1 Tax=Pseudonocardia sulfidoxydans NBRC 16205 TaxID=1223511 RepID=A0A511DJ20_9PSEU|nr:hypothetical protein [Pseudonocardia sulfidoxydans]GEL24802.1 hypothetical protein PSU4_37560 [Pseudonocardia sulfidoxydans NBRC 16205]
MTPFMHNVQALLDGEPAPATGTEQSLPTPMPVATDTQVIVRSLAEQLVSEANAVLRARGDVISLDDVVGPGELAFTLGYRDRAARVQTVMSGRSALVSLVVTGRQEEHPRRLTGEDELQSLLLNLIAPA